MDIIERQGYNFMCIYSIKIQEHFYTFAVKKNHQGQAKKASWVSLLLNEYMSRHLRSKFLVLWTFHLVNTELLQPLQHPLWVSPFQAFTACSFLLTSFPSSIPSISVFPIIVSTYNSATIIFSFKSWFPASVFISDFKIINIITLYSKHSHGLSKIIIKILLLEITLLSLSSTDFEHMISTSRDLLGNIFRFSIYNTNILTKVSFQFLKLVLQFRNFLLSASFSTFSTFLVLFLWAAFNSRSLDSSKHRSLDFCFSSS